MDWSDKDLIEKARHCMRIEMNAVALTAERLDQCFVRCVRLLEVALKNDRKLVLTGVGKNVAVCQKVAGTFNSIGVPTTLLDPNQALHGDLGLCQDGDLCLLFSNSGETTDLLRLLPSLKRLGLTTVAVTARTESSLAKACEHCLPFHYEEEACPLNLAPTASTTAAMALGDALAMVMLELRNFTRSDFARYHPAGSLGQALLLKVDDIMRKDAQFAVAPDTVTVQEALLAITNARCGCIALTDPDSGKISGVFSDGDFRRAALAHADILRMPVATFMTRKPRFIRSGAMAVEALKVFEQSSVNDLPVIDSLDKPVGLVDGQDMPKMRII